MIISINKICHFVPNYPINHYYGQKVTLSGWSNVSLKNNYSKAKYKSLLQHFWSSDIDKKSW